MSLLLGCALAVVARRGLPAVSSRLLLYAGLAVLSATALLHPAWTATSEASLTFVSSVIAVIVLWTAIGSPGAILRWRSLRYCGRRSYALYLWHPPIFFVVWTIVRPGVPATLLATVLTFGVAELSWRYVEAPFLTATWSSTRDALARPRAGARVGSSA